MAFDDTTVRARIRALLQTGELPCESPERTWAGNGLGKRCHACGETIRPDDVEVEVDLPSKQTVRLHGRCHVLWLEECEPPPRG